MQVHPSSPTSPKTDHNEKETVWMALLNINIDDYIWRGRPSLCTGERQEHHSRRGSCGVPTKEMPVIEPVSLKDQQHVGTENSEDILMPG